MINNFKEWKKSRARLLDDDVTPEEDEIILKEMDEFESKHPDLFRELREDKWSADGLIFIHPD